MSQTILVVGNSFRTQTQYLHEHGYKYIILKDIRLAKNRAEQLPHHVLCDFSSKETILNSVESLTRKHHIDGVTALYERYILAAAEIAAYIGAPGLPLAAAHACTDKSLMRQLFARAPEQISPDFAVATTASSIEAFAAHHAFPLILKPANLSKSLLVSKNNTLTELMENYEHMDRTIEAVYEKYAPDATPKILIEEFMEGSVHSVDAFIDSDGVPHVLEQVVDYQTGYDIGYGDNFHYSRLLPSKLPPEKIVKIRNIAALGCKALGMKNSPAHIEIIYTARGPRIVEIGARNGGYRERMHRLANDIDVPGNALRVILGEPPVVTSTKNEPVGVFELFPRTPGTFVEITNEATLRSLPSLAYYSVKAKPYTFVGKSSDGYKMCAVVILHNADHAQFATDLAYLNQHVAVRTV